MMDCATRNNNEMVGVVVGPERTHRIPLALQSIFLASNRGEDVDPTQVPAHQVASRTFQNSWTSLINATSFTLKEFDRTDQFKSTTACSCNQRNLPVPQPSTTASTMEPHPQAFLENLLKERGYCNEDIQRFRTLDTAYYHKPTPLQLASYEHHLVSLIKSKNVTEFKKLVTCGISPNACNAFGESIVHMVCRRNDEEMLNILLQAGADLQVSDDYGRTPLHDAFWAGEPATDIVHTILSRDPHMLFLADARGTLPTGYIKRDHYETWNEFWRTHVDQYFPLPSSNELLHAQPNTRPVPDPHHAVPLSRAKLVAANRIQAHALALLSHATTTTTTTTTTSDLKEGEEESLEDDTADISYSYDIEDDESSYEDDDSEEYDDESFYSSDEEDDEDFEEEVEDDDDLHEDLTNILEAFYKTRQ